jgi:hypothetical protein
MTYTERRRPLVTVSGHGAVLVLPVVRRRLVAFTGPVQRCLRARAEAARMRRLALASVRSRGASQRGVASG